MASAEAWQRTGRYTMIGVVNDPRVDRVPSPPGTSRKRVRLDCSAKPNVVRAVVDVVRSTMHVPRSQMIRCMLGLE